MARILLGVTGGIAAYRALEFARLATTQGHSLRVVMTDAATRFVGPASFEGIVGAPVLTSEFDRDPMRGAYPGETQPAHNPIGHLAVVESADAYLVAPASANTVAKLASGLADSMLTTSFLACTAPRLIAPAMNDRMFRDAATQANLAILRERGVVVIDPDEGPLASRGEYGSGRLAQPAELLRAVEASLPAHAGPWDGLRVLVTAGGTREPIDAVRYIGNRSSGRMGVALARAAALRGADVCLVAANVGIDTPPGIRRIDLETAAELAAASKREARNADVVLMAAAVADFAPDRTDGKLAREGSGGLHLHLTETEDVIAAIAAEDVPGRLLIGFAAEHGAKEIERARSKLERKGLDAVVFNDVSRPEIGFDSELNEVTIVTSDSEREIPISSKDEVAVAVLESVDSLRRETGQARTG